MNIHLATDHAGYDLKEFLKAELIALEYNVVDHGALTLDKDDDYPDFVIPCAQAVAEEPNSFGIIIGLSGQGEAMCANSIPGARSGIYYGGHIEIVTLLRQHNNANILSLGAKFITQDEALEAVKLFLETEFSGTERHLRRINKFTN